MSPLASPDRIAGGRLAVLTAFAMGASTIPIPFLPDRLICRVRGAVVHDVAAARGLSLTSEARRALAEPDSPQHSHPVIRKAAGALTRRVLRRLGPLGAAWPARRGLEVYALGHLFDRYVVTLRQPGTVRVHGKEALAVRDVIDRAVLHALSPALTPHMAALGSAPEDLRDEFTRWIDALLLTGASLPGYVERRLDAAFDAVVAQSSGIGDD